MKEGEKSQKKRRVGRPKKKKSTYQDTDGMESFTPSPEFDWRYNTAPIIRATIQKIIFD